MTFAIDPGATIVFAGDSITDAGRTAGLGQVGDRFLGEGYVRDAVGLIGSRYPGHRLDVHNIGIGGITSAHLVELWPDVIARKPDWVTVLIGINDCNLTRAGSELAVGPEDYRRNCVEILDQTAGAGARIVLLEPFYLRTDDEPADVHRRTLSLLDEYLAIVDDLAVRYDALHVPTHEAFQRQLQTRPLTDLTPDHVHLTHGGNLVVAHALLTALGW